MRDPLVPVLAHDVNLLIERLFVQAEMKQQVRFETGNICDDIFPTVLSLLVTKEFAPVQYTHINEIAVHHPPEIEIVVVHLKEVLVFLAPSDAEVGKIPNKGRAQ